jgi:two-component system sensor histidine kinase KdpD
MGASAHYIPIISQAKVLGVIGVSCVDRKIDQNSRLFLRMMANQVAMAWSGRTCLTNKGRSCSNLRKRKMRSTCPAISHDIRTPLTGIPWREFRDP